MRPVGGRRPVANLVSTKSEEDFRSQITDCRLQWLSYAAALVASASAAYVIEWTAPLSYSMAYGYTSNANYSYDITGDSNPEIYVSDSTALKVYNGVTHSLIWTIPLAYSYGGYPIIANTDVDANKELVFSSYNYTPQLRRQVLCLRRPNPCSGALASPVKSGYLNVSVADVDGDGKSEICCISGAAGSRILEAPGGRMPRTFNETPAPVARERLASPFRIRRAARRPVRWLRLGAFRTVTVST